LTVEGAGIYVVVLIAPGSRGSTGRPPSTHGRRARGNGGRSGMGWPIATPGRSRTSRFFNLPSIVQPWKGEGPFFFPRPPAGRGEPHESGAPPSARVCQAEGPIAR